VAVSVIALAVGVVIYGGSLKSASSSTGTITSVVQAESSQIPVVRAAFDATIAIHQSFGNPAPGFTSSATAAIRSRRVAPAMSAATRQQIFSSQHQALLAAFTGSQVASEEADLRDNMTLDANPDIVNLGSGVSNIKILKVAIAGTRATVEADVTVWAKSYVRQSGNAAWIYAAPINIVDYTATLLLNASGRWQVASLTGNFVPGYGP
jgi:hypothetical protein